MAVVTSALLTKVALRVAIGTAGVAVGSALTKTRPRQSRIPNRRRTPRDYMGTSFYDNDFSGRLAAPIQHIKPIQPISPIAPIPTIDTISPIKPIDPWDYVYFHTDIPKNFYNEYNDPYNINSLVDVLLNRQGKNLVLKDLGMDWATYIPVVQELIVGVDHIKRNYAAPLSEGKFFKAGMNALVATGETMDLLSNPVKGLFMDGPKGIIRGLGIGNEGRTQYDFDVNTGNAVLDFGANMIFEALADPVNLAKSALDATVKHGVTKTLINNSPNMQRRVAQELIQNGKLANSTMFEMFQDLEPLYKNRIKHWRDLAYKANQEMFNLLNADKIYKSVSKLYNTVDTFDRTLFKATPVGATLHYVGKPLFGSNADSAVSRIHNYFVKKYTKATIKDVVPSDVIHADAFAINRALSDTAKTTPIAGGFKTLSKAYTDLTKLKGSDAVDATVFLKYLLDEGYITRQEWKQLKLDPNFQEVYEAVVLKAEQFKTLYDIATNPVYLKTELNKLKEGVTSYAELAPRFMAFLNKYLDTEDTPFKTTHQIFQALQDHKITLQKAQKAKRIELARVKTDPVLESELDVLALDIVRLDKQMQIIKEFMDEIGLRNSDFAEFDLLSDNLKQVYFAANTPEKQKALRKQLAQENINLKKQISEIDAQIQTSYGVLDGLKANTLSLKKVNSKRIIEEEASKVPVTKKSFKVKDKEFEDITKRYNIFTGEIEEKATTEIKDSIMRKAKETVEEVTAKTKHISNKTELGKILLFIDDLKLGKIKNIDEAFLDVYNPNYAEILKVLKKQAILLQDLYNMKQIIQTQARDNKALIKYIDAPRTKRPIKAAVPKRIMDDIEIQNQDKILRMTSTDATNIDDLLLDESIDKSFREEAKAIIEEQRTSVINAMEQYLDKTGNAQYLTDLEKEFKGDYITEYWQKHDPKVLKMRQRFKDLLASGLKKNSDIEEAMDLFALDPDYAFNAEEHHTRLINILFQNEEDIWLAKTSQAAIHINILKELESNPVLTDFINDLALGTNHTVEGTIFNSLANADLKNTVMDVGSNEFKALQEIAKGTVLYKNLFANLKESLDPETFAAAIDFFSGYGYFNKQVFYNKFFKDGVINKELIRTNLYDRLNSFTHVYGRKNSGLATYFGIEYDESKLHEALYDVGITRQNHAELIKRGAMATPEDGEIFTHFDIETTGEFTDAADLSLDQIVEISASKSKWNAELQQFDLLDEQSWYAHCDKGYALNPELIANGTFSSDFVKAVTNSENTETEIIESFKEFMEGTIVGHNSDGFDIPRIKARDNGSIHFEAIKSLDTLKGADKMFGAKEIADTTVDNVAELIEKYYRNIEGINTDHVISLMDARALDKMYDTVRNLINLTRELAPSDLKERLGHAHYLEALEKLIGTTKYSTLLEMSNHEFTDAIQAFEYEDAQSFIKSLRSLLHEIKERNRYLGTQVITRSKLAYLADNYLVKGVGIDGTPKLQLDAFVLFNGTRLEDTTEGLKLIPSSKFLLSDTSTKRYRPKEFKRIDYNKERRALLQEHTHVIKAIDTLDDINTDYAAKSEAAAYLAAHDLSYAQGSRLKYMLDLQEQQAVPRADLPKRVAVATDQIHATSDNYINLGYEYTEALEKLSFNLRRTLNDDIAIQDTISKLSLTPEELMTYITHQGVDCLGVGDINNPAYAQLIANLIANESTFKSFGYEIRVDKDKLFIVPDATVPESVRDTFKKQHNTPITLHKRQTTIGADVPEVQELIKRGDEIFHTFNQLEDPHYPEAFLTDASNIMYADSFYRIRRVNRNFFRGTGLDLDTNNSKVTKFFRPSSKDTTLAAQRNIKYTDCFIGSVSGRRAIDPYYQVPLNHTMGLMEHSIKRMNSKSKYIQLVFNNDLSINGKLYADVLDTELLSAFKEKSQDYTMLVLTTDKRGRMVVRSFKPDNMQDFVWAKKMDAVIVPLHEANKIKQTINVDTFDDMFKNPLLQIFYKYIIAGYKGLYLSSIGVPVRNFLDVIVKNTIDENNGIEQLPRTIREFMQAARDWRTYSDTVDAIIYKHGRLDANAIDYYFENLATITSKEHAQNLRNLFEEVHKYAISNASAGMSDAQQKLLMSFYNPDGPNIFTKLFEKNPILNINGLVEHAGRLSSYRMAMQDGLSMDEALSKTVRRHFDYGTKSKAQAILEFAIPFSTFPIYNIQYWVDAVTDSPWLIEMLIDASRVSLDVEEQNQFMIENSQALQSRMNNGQIKIGNTLLKTNPSLYDALGMANLPEQIGQRVLTPWKAIARGVAGIESKTDVSKNYTNLQKIGLGETEKIMNEYLGLYPITRIANGVLKGVAELGNNDGLTGVENIYADTAPSFFKDVTRKKKLPPSYYRAPYVKQFHATTYPKTTKTVGRNYNRIPHTYRYYSPNYNIYNRWKAKRVRPYNTTVPPTMQSLGYTFKGLLYETRMNRKILKVYNRKPKPLRYQR